MNLVAHVSDLGHHACHLTLLASSEGEEHEQHHLSHLTLLASLPTHPSLSAWLECDEDEEEGEDELVEEEEPQINENYKDYDKIFPGVFLAEKDIVRGPSVAKLRGDELKIMRELVQKYDDNIDRMFMDIKTNILQWSKG